MGALAVWTDNGCCKHVQEILARNEWQSFEWQNATFGKWVTKHNYRNVTQCVEFEKLYRCSGSGSNPKIGTTQTGKLYRRISKHIGICIGDQQSKLRLKRSKTGFYRCPIGRTSSAGAKRCQCDVD